MSRRRRYTRHAVRRVSYVCPVQSFLLFKTFPYFYTFKRETSGTDLKLKEETCKWINLSIFLPFEFWSVENCTVTRSNTWNSLGLEWKLFVFAHFSTVYTNNEKSVFWLFKRKINLWATKRANLRERERCESGTQQSGCCRWSEKRWRERDGSRRRRRRGEAIRFGPMGGNLLQDQTPPTFLQDPAPFLSRVLPLSIDCYVHSI